MVRFSCLANDSLIIDMAAPVSGVLTTTWSFILTFIFIAVVRIGSISLTEMSLFLVVLRAVVRSLLKFVVPDDNKDPMVVLTGAFHTSGTMSYGFTGGNESSVLASTWLA